MKFCKQIQAAAGTSTSLCSEDKWLNYKLLKKLIKKIPSEIKTGADADSQQESILKNSEQERSFFLQLRRELKKVSACFKELEQEALRNLVHLQRECLEAEPGSEPVKTLNDCTAMHMSLLMLENYAVLNYAGFTKILKKHDKVTGFSTKEKFLLRLVHSQPFVLHPWLRSSIKAVEELFKEVKDRTQFAQEGADKKLDCGNGADQTMSNVSLEAKATAKPSNQEALSENNNPKLVKPNSAPASNIPAQSTMQPTSNFTQGLSEPHKAMEDGANVFSPALKAMVENAVKQMSNAHTSTLQSPHDTSCFQSSPLQQPATDNGGSVRDLLDKILSGAVSPPFTASTGQLGGVDGAQPGAVYQLSQRYHKELFKFHSQLETDQGKNWMDHAFQRASLFSPQGQHVNQNALLPKSTTQETYHKVAAGDSAGATNGNQASASKHTFSLSRTLDTLAFLAQQRLAAAPYSPQNQEGSEQMSATVSHDSSKEEGSSEDEPPAKRQRSNSFHDPAKKNSP